MPAFLRQAPSEQRLFLLAAPWLGFRGALRLAEQVLHALPPAQRG